LRADNYEAIKSRVGSVEVHHASMTDYLGRQAARSLHRYVLLDAQDWMSAEQMTALWVEIDRTADDKDARVIFRTAGAESPLPKKLPPSLLANWVYLEEESKAFHGQDRSSIYGGFHVYARRQIS
jgi:S-adenosylmethionine-diacylglycerol 3-amino-3-carboxypropyl transferase